MCTPQKEFMTKTSLHITCKCFIGETRLGSSHLNTVDLYKITAAVIKNAVLYSSQDSAHNVQTVSFNTRKPLGRFSPYMTK